MVKKAKRAIFRITFLFLLKIIVKITRIYAGIPIEIINGIPHQDKLVHSGESAAPKLRPIQ